jgi:predicted nucleic acid-binding protein
LRLRLVDTGPLVAYLDGADAAHAVAVASLDGWRGRLATTSAVVTEAMHLVAEARQGPRLLAELLAVAGVEVHDFTQPVDLPPVVALMERYANVPMDFADATLVLLAEVLGAPEIVTLDRRGFSTYRTRKGKALRIILDA